MAAREDMFGTKVPEFLAEKRIGGGDPSSPAFNEDHPLFRAIREVASVRRNNPPLQSGIQIVQYAEDKPGILAVSRIDPNTREEMLVAFNNSSETRKADVKVFSPAGNWERVYASGAKGINFGPGARQQNLNRNCGVVGPGLAESTSDRSESRAAKRTASFGGSHQ